jgi:hypothetical protein
MVSLLKAASTDPPPLVITGGTSLALRSWVVNATMFVGAIMVPQPDKAAVNAAATARPIKGRRLRARGVDIVVPDGQVKKRRNEIVVTIR